MTVQPEGELLLLDPNDVEIVETSEEQHLKSLVESIRLLGVVSPITVSMKPSADSRKTPKATVIDGRRRVLATRIVNDELRAAGLPTIQIACRVARAEELVHHENIRKRVAAKR